MKQHFTWTDVLNVFIIMIPLCSSGQNLISNPDFETNGELICHSWFDGCGEELTYVCENVPPEPVCDVFFFQDAPSLDGVWSIGVLGVGNSFPGMAKTYITGQEGTNHYELNAWIKDTGNAWGGIEIGKISEGSYSAIKSIQADSGNWTLYTIEFIETFLPSDSIQITLSAFAAGPLFGTIYFDVVELYLQDTLSNEGELEAGEFILFPNPSRGQVNVQIEKYNGIKELFIFDSAGHQLRQVEWSTGKLTVDLSGLPSGIYYCILQGPEGNKRGIKKFRLE